MAVSDARRRSAAEYLRTILRYAAVFTWSDLLLFKVSDVLTGWVSGARLRRASSLRLFSYVVPPRQVTVSDGHYVFTSAINGRDSVFRLRVDSSDVDVFLNVVEGREYADMARRLLRMPGAPRIIDAGANIGLTTLYFKRFRPDAQVVALEPEPSNFAMLGRCVHDNSLADVRLFKEGLWTADNVLAPERGFRDGRDWSFALKEGPIEAAEGFRVSSLASLLSRVGWDAVDLLKMDIEGAEAALFRDAAFLDALKTAVPLLCMEVHEEVIRQSEIQEALEGIGMASVGWKGTLVAWRAVDPSPWNSSGAPSR